MKKKFIAFTIVTILIVTLLTGCSKEKPEVYVEKNTTTFTLDDSRYGVATMEYSNDSDFVFEKDDEYTEYTLISEKLNLEADIYLTKSFDPFEENKKSHEEAEGYAEYTFNGYNAYTYSQYGTDSGLHVFIFVKDGTADTNSTIFYMDLSKYSYDIDTDLKEVFESDLMKSMLDTIYFTPNT